MFKSLFVALLTLTIGTAAMASEMLAKGDLFDCKGSVAVTASDSAQGLQVNYSFSGLMLCSKLELYINGTQVKWGKKDSGTLNLNPSKKQTGPFGAGGTISPKYFRDGRNSLHFVVHSNNPNGHGETKDLDLVIIKAGSAPGSGGAVIIVPSSGTPNPQGGS